MKIGDIITYNYPAVPLVSFGGYGEGKIIKFCKNESIMVEDIEIQPGEYKLYKHIINKDQIISIK